MIRLFFSKYGITDKLLVTDFLSVEVRFKDIETNRFISREEARKLLETEPERVQSFTLWKGKTDLPEFRIQKGKYVSTEVMTELFDYLNLHNTAIGLSQETGLNLESAFDCVEEVYSAYVRGDINADEWSSALEECLGFPPSP